MINKISLICILFFFFVQSTLAAPYFYISTTPPSTIQWAPTVLDVYLYTDSQTLTAAQTVLGFDPTYLTGSSINITNSVCTFWAPADPSLGYGNTPSPFFYQQNKAVLSCGFTNPGYTSTTAFGNRVARVVFQPILFGSTTLTFTNTQFRYIGNIITPGTSPNYDLSIQYASQGAIPTPTPTPDPNATPTPAPSATPFTAATPVPTHNYTTFGLDDLNFVDVNTSGTSTTTSSTGLSSVSQVVTSGAAGSVVERDNTIPPPPENLDRRPSATPFLLSLLQGDTSFNQDSGDVLAAQSLRELLIPGKSQADKTVVMINLISTLTFVTLLAIVIWRLITVSRLNKLKSAHMKEMLTSELAALESKIGAISDPDAQARLKQDLNQTVDKIATDDQDKKR